MKGGPIKSSLADRLRDVYVSWTLFLGSYVPLLLTFAVRMVPKHPDYVFFACALAGVLLLNMSALLNANTAPRAYSLAEVESGATELTTYIATYILPFVVTSEIGPYDLCSYGMLLFFVGLVLTRSGAIHVNPALAVLGLRLTTVVTADGERFYLIASREVRVGDETTAVLIQGRLLYER